MPTTVIVLPNSVQTFRPLNAELARVQDNLIKCVNPILSFLNGAFKQQGTPTINYAPTSTVAAPVKSLILSAWDGFNGTNAARAVINSSNPPVLSAPGAFMTVMPFSGSLAAMSISSQPGTSGIAPPGLITGTFTVTVYINNAASAAALGMTAPAASNNKTFIQGAIPFNVGDYMWFVMQSSSITRPASNDGFAYNLWAYLS